MGPRLHEKLHREFRSTIDERLRAEEGGPIKEGDASGGDRPDVPTRGTADAHPDEMRTGNRQLVVAGRLIAPTAGGGVQDLTGAGEFDAVGVEQRDLGGEAGRRCIVHRERASRGGHHTGARRRGDQRRPLTIGQVG
ncbi:unannotated protein [freshwater metagenome]|uniref:Unannotated protein n=1 Tax=freshwater metagenome TaxID=449393 RepID=A0A6J5YBY7_9ZZZZ